MQDAEDAGKLEDGKGPWNTPCFPVPKKNGKFRLVQDLRPQNEATIKDGHPLPRIGTTVQKQGKFKIWTTLDLVDGFHQMPLKTEHRYITCLSTPLGTKQWKVLVMGLKTSGTQFQRMMEWILKDHPEADPYIDDVIVWSEGADWFEALHRNFDAVRRVLLKFKEQRIICKPAKKRFCEDQVEYSGHILFD